ncbi:ABC transporter family substrate-binding protein [Streptomyces sp. A7024]|uniref:ABC transporter family substrate-binding protein n=1 Tax=Streptomyces coryli TaxID=1128680 RepID=A0A6G4TVI8_9ACTN|nr:ABC transporter family substrate-binding protein [Streptomyces coryli]NGN63456.1 ABC transporter family substrate-binding protein [Streptomyces coryli]
MTQVSRRQRHRAARAAAALAAAGLVLPLAASCSSGGAASSTAAEDVTTAQRSALKSGGTVRWAVDALPHTYNAFQVDAGEATDRVAEAVLPALFTTDKHGRPQLNEDYLRSAEVTKREPRQKVVYQLNPKARWSDGRRIGIADFRAQWMALNGKNNAFWTARNAGYDRIKSIKPGKKSGEIEVTFKEPYADWQGLFTPLYPKSVMGSPDAFNDTSRTELDVVAGPFTLDDGSKDDGKKGDKKDRKKPKLSKKRGVELVRNAEWWGSRPALDKLVFKPVKRADREQALADGRIDIAEVDRDFALEVAQARKAMRQKARTAQAAGKPQHAKHISSTEKQADDKNKGSKKLSEAEKNTAELPKKFTVRKALEPAYTQLALNGSSGPLADEAVRHAVARAVDRGEVARSVLGPLGLPARPLGSHLFMSVQQGYEDHSAALGEQDVQAAQALLAEAGWKGGPIGRKNGTADAKQEDSKPGMLAPRAIELPFSVAAGADMHRTALREQAKLLKVASKYGEDGTEYAKAKKAARATQARMAKESDPLAAAPRNRPFVKDGKPLTLKFVVPSDEGSAQLRAVAARIVRMLDSIGVQAKIIKAGGDSYFKDYIAAGQYDLALYSWPGTAYPATDARPIYAKPQPAPDGSLLVEQNYTRVGTDEVDQLFDQAAGELDPTAQRQLLAKADTRIWAAAGSLPLYQRPQLVATKNGLMNTGAHGFATPRYQDIGWRR